MVETSRAASEGSLEEPGKSSAESSAKARPAADAGRNSAKSSAESSSQTRCAGRKLGKSSAMSPVQRENVQGKLVWHRDCLPALESTAKSSAKISAKARQKLGDNLSRSLSHEVALGPFRHQIQHLRTNPCRMRWSASQFDDVWPFSWRPLGVVVF